MISNNPNLLVVTLVTFKRNEKMPNKSWKLKKIIKKIRKILKKLKN